MTPTIVAIAGGQGIATLFSGRQPREIWLVFHTELEELPADKRSLLDTLSDTNESAEDREHTLEGGVLNVYRAMANNADLLKAFQTYGTAVWNGGKLLPHEREFVILSVAYDTRLNYEWHQHVRVGLDEGLTPEQIHAVSSDDLDRLTAYYDDDIVLGIGMLAGNYLGLSHLLDALDVENEVEFVGWNLENL